jgi:hypothetical protein
VTVVSGTAILAPSQRAVTLASGHDNLPGNRHLLRPNQALRLRSLAAETEPRGEFVQLILGVGRQFKPGVRYPASPPLLYDCSLSRGA